MLLVVLVAMTVYRFASAAEPRSATARAEFIKANPCLATGKSRGPCPGYVVDHVTPLCAGGADTPANMQWQTTTDAKLKDRAEHAQCRALRNLR